MRSVLLTVSMPNGPNPCPAALMAMVAIPCAAIEAATVKLRRFLLSVFPWPRIATGHPAAGLGLEGKKRLK